MNRHDIVSLHPRWVERLGLPPALQEAVARLAGVVTWLGHNGLVTVTWNCEGETEIPIERIALIDPRPHRLPSIQYQDAQLVRGSWHRLTGPLV